MKTIKLSNRLALFLYRKCQQIGMTTLEDMRRMLQVFNAIQDVVNASEMFIEETKQEAGVFNERLRLLKKSTTKSKKQEEEMKELDEKINWYIKAIGENQETVAEFQISDETASKLLEALVWLATTEFVDDKGLIRRGVFGKFEIEDFLQIYDTINNA